MGRSELRLCRLQVLDGLEAAVAGVLDHLLGLPVGSENGALASADSGHLESEEIEVGLHRGLAHAVGGGVEDAAVLEEASRKAAKNDDLFLGDLDHTGALALSELGGRDVDDLPGLTAVLGVVALDGVAVLLARLGDAAEDVDVALVVSARGVVVAADVEVGDFEPQI